MKTATIKKKRRKIKLFDVVNGIIMVLLSVVCIYPLYYVLMASFSNPTDLMAHRGILLYPLGGGTLGGYEMVLQNPNIGTGYFNTLIYSGGEYSPKPVPHRAGGLCGLPQGVDVVPGHDLYDYPAHVRGRRLDPLLHAGQ